MRVFIAATLIALISCKDKPVTTPVPPTTQEAKIEQLSIDQTDFTRFTYRADGKLSTYQASWKQHDGSINTFTNTYVYTNGRLTKLVTGGGYTNYIYAGETLVRLEHYTNQQKHLSTSYPIFENDLLVSLREDFHQSEPGQAVSSLMTYQYDDRKNLSISRYYYKLLGDIDYTLADRTAYLNYDNSINAEVSNTFLPWVKLFTNNPGEVINTYPSGQVVYKIQYQYTYDVARNRPIQKSVYRIVGSTTTGPLTWNYTYQQ